MWSLETSTKNIHEKTQVQKMPCDPSARGSKLSILQEGHIKRASNKARIAEYQKTIDYLQGQINFLEKENRVWDFCFDGEEALSGNLYHANVEQSQNYEGNPTNPFYANLKEESHQNEGFSTKQANTGDREKYQRTEDECSYIANSSGSKTSAIQRISPKWYRKPIELLMSRKKNRNSETFAYR